jgi:hypothetical protein
MADVDITVGSAGGFWTTPARDPKRNYRWLVIFPNMPQGATWYAKKVVQPKFSISEAEHKYLNHTFYYPGRVTWEKVTATLVDPVSPHAQHHFLAAVAASGYVIPRDSTSVTTISKARANKVWNGIKIQQLTSGINKDSGVLQTHGDAVIGEWTLNNAWLSDVSFSDLDYESDDLSEIEIQLRYDFATYESKLNSGLLPELKKLIPDSNSSMKDENIAFEPHGP